MPRTGRPKIGKRAINETIKSRREERNLTKAQFAKLIGVDRTMPAHWDNQRCSPSPSRLPTIAAVLKLSLARLNRELREVIP